jgi:hypothetical protein
MGGGRGAATKVLWNIVVLEKRCPELRQLGDKFLSTLLTSVSFNPQIRNIESIGLKCRALEYAWRRAVGPQAHRCASLRPGS